MSKSVFEEAHFADAEKARELIEKQLWPNGPICGHCGEKDLFYATKRPGRYRCGNPECRKDFTVTTGTVMESSHVPLHKWLQAFHVAASSKKGFSAHQLHRTLKITYKSAWFLWHRVRLAMAAGSVTPLGGEGKIVEADETYIGRKPGRKKKQGFGHKHTVAALVERGGSVRSFHVTRNMTRGVAREILFRNVDLKSRLMTDEAPYYTTPGDYYAGHEFVTHSKDEYVRGEAHTNTIEGVFSIFKRGMIGTYQHCGEKHLHRYLSEFDFRYNHRSSLGWDDDQRTLAALRGAEGKRLVYKKTS